MLKLPSAAPAWLAMPQGVRVLHRPATGAEIEAASAWAAGRAASAVEDAAAAARGRLGVAEVPEPAPEKMRALVTGYVVIGLGRLCIAAWEGVDAPCEPDAIERLLTMPEMAAAYLPAALGLADALAAEGNGSAPAPNGTTAGAQNTATAAGA
jgi:hypothetical protein